MKKYILIISLLITAFAGCKKDKFDSAAQAAKDEAAIQAYLTANPSIQATKGTNGLYYQILKEGTGAKPTSTSIVSVNYVGKLLNGNTFDEGNLSNMPLTNLVPGWGYGLPYVNTGGRILLILPSALGYGNSSPGAAIPANSVLVFTIDLLSFK
jgi:FKBP-type peptidyl-prolyl cis-trans isomerase FkpA